VRLEGKIPAERAMWMAFKKGGTVMRIHRKGKSLPKRGKNGINGGEENRRNGFYIVLTRKLIRKKKSFIS